MKSGFLRTCTLLLGLAVATLATGCITTGSLLDAEGFPARYVTAMDKATELRQGAAIAVVAGGLKADDAIRKAGELDEAVRKLELDRTIRMAESPEMAAALERYQKAKQAFDRAMAAVRPPSQ